MNIKILITTLVLGSATVSVASTASAEPRRGDYSARIDNRNQRITPSLVVRDHRAVERDRFERPQVSRSRVERTVFERPRLETRWEQQRPWVDARWEVRRPVVEHRVVRPIIRERFEMRTPVARRSR